MFPHTVTIYHHSIVNDTDTYEKYTVEGAYWFGPGQISLKNKGVEAVSNVTVIFSPEQSKQFGKRWKAQKGDRIIQGAGEDITSFKDIPNALSIVGIEDNLVGSAVDNVVLSAK